MVGRASERRGVSRWSAARSRGNVPVDGLDGLDGLDGRSGVGHVLILRFSIGWPKATVGGRRTKRLARAPVARGELPAASGVGSISMPAGCRAAPTRRRNAEPCPHLDLKLLQPIEESRVKIAPVVGEQVPQEPQLGGQQHPRRRHSFARIGQPTRHCSASSPVTRRSRSSWNIPVCDARSPRPTE